MSAPNRIAAIALCAGLAGTVYAQPALTEDLGALPTGTTISRPVTFSGGAVFWYKITIPAVPASAAPGALYLDIRTAEPGGGTIIDTEIGLYDATGAFASGAAATSTDDDDGPGLASALSYGAACPTRANPGAGTQTVGVDFNGRDGALVGGDYYLAVSPYNTVFATNFGVTPGNQNGNMTLEITLGAASAGAPTFTAGAASPSSVAQGGSTLVTVTSAPCNLPSTVTIDLSAFGGSATATLFNDGTNGDVTAGDTIFSRTINIPGATAPGAYTLTATGTNGSGSGTRDVTVTVVPPPATLTPVGGVYTEIEDNEPRTRANNISAMSAGQSISGTTTGTSLTAVGAITSADTFRVRTATAAPGIYRNRLTLTTTGTAGHTGTIRGLNQSATGIDGASDAAFQTSSTTTTPPRFNQWHSFGSGGSIYYRVTGTTSTTAPYSATLTVDPITPVSLGTFAAGELTISTVGQGHTTDTDFWIYDGAFNAIPDFGSDDESTFDGGTGATLQSLLRRNFAPGTYYLGLSNYNSANNLPSPTTDDFRLGGVVDFPGVFVNSTTTTVANMAFAITDSAGTLQFPAAKPGAFDVYWATFTVSGGSTCGTADFDGDGDTGTDADIEAFFACLGGNCCATCFPGGADFDGDGDTGTDADIEAFFRVLAGGNC